MTVTPETLTDEMISSLMHELAERGERSDLVRDCSRALFSRIYRGSRQRIVDAINARAKESK